MRHLFLLLLLLPCLAHGQDFLTRDLVVNNRQLQEIRLGATTRLPPSGIASAALVAVVVTNGPVGGTTSLMGSVIDGGTLYTGGTAPTFASIIAQGSAFGLGGGCQRGTITDFPVINQNRPRVARFDAGTGLFTLLTPPIPGSDLYDSTACVAKNGILYFLVSNRSLSRLEVYSDSGSGWTFVTSYSGVITPFAGGIRPTLATYAQENALMTVYQLTNGQILARRIELGRGASGTCLLASPLAPVGFTVVLEAALIQMIISDSWFTFAADVNRDGFAEIYTFDLDGACTVYSFAANGTPIAGNGYNWGSFAVIPGRVFGDPVNLFFTLLATAAIDSPASLSPYASPKSGNGGPIAACDARLWQIGDGYIAAGAGINNTHLSLHAPVRARVLHRADQIAQMRQEANVFAGIECGPRF